MAIQYDQPWRRALISFAEKGFNYGDTVSLDWIEKAMGFKQDIKNNPEEYFILKANNTTSFIDNVLIEHKMHLVNVKGIGYRVAMPKEQTGLAMQSLADTIIAKAKKTERVLNNIDRRRLNASDKRKNLDAIANLASIQTFAKKRIRGPDKIED